MKSLILFWAMIGSFIGISSLHAEPVAPAVRVMSFSGVANFGVKSDPVKQETLKSVCMVQVSNVDSELQVLEKVIFGPGSMSADDSIFQGLKGSKAECPLPAKLAKGESCIFFKRRSPVSATNRIFSCNGTISVANEGVPGSVIAAGALVTLSEMELIGGVLSGAYYASGTHIAYNSAQEKGNEIVSFSDSLHTHNMNLNCVKSCTTQVGSDSQAFCELQCGELKGDPLFAHRSPGIGKANGQSASGVISAGLIGQVTAGTYDDSSNPSPYSDRSITRFPQKNINIRMPLMMGGCTTGERTQDGQKTNCTVLVPNAQLSYDDLSPPFQIAGRSLHPFSPSDAQSACSLFSGDGNNRTDIRPTLMRDILGIDNALGVPEPAIAGRNDSLETTFPMEARGKYLPERARDLNSDYDYLMTVGGQGSKGNPLPADPTRAVGRVSPSLAKGYPTASFARGNSHFGGGLVYEVLAGSSQAICTGNKSSYSAGGFAPILHGHLQLDADQQQLGLSAIGSAMDLLYCSHRHQNMDWTLSVGKSSPFLINAGMEF